ncbi:MAG: LacI family DNA-binding transcriptional regulator [Halanaerobiales bacterium]
MKKISIKEVANFAGVSPTTVSRVINNSDHPVSQETRKKVEKAVEELNFEPNRMARGLTSNRSNIIGVIVHDISDDYFAEILKGIESILYKDDYIINIYNTYRDVKREIKAANILKANRADAVVFTGGALLDEEYNREITPIIDQLKSNGSIVIGVTSHPFADIDFEIGNLSAAKKVTGYLFEKGHVRIGYLNGPEILNTSYQRYRGFLQAFKDNDYRFDYRYLFSGDFSFEGGRRAADKIAGEIGDLTAVVAANDEMALGLMWELKNQGFDVPGDISVVGIGDIPSAKFGYPPLTTLALPIYKTGVTIGNYIVNYLNGKKFNDDNSENVLELVERDSVLKIGD